MDPDKATLTHSHTFCLSVLDLTLPTTVLSPEQQFLEGFCSLPLINFKHGTKSCKIVLHGSTVTGEGKAGLESNKRRASNPSRLEVMADGLDMVYDNTNIQKCNQLWFDASARGSIYKFLILVVRFGSGSVVGAVTGLRFQ